MSEPPEDSFREFKSVVGQSRRFGEVRITSVLLPIATE